MLTSNDPNYRQKLQAITDILQNLKADEKTKAIPVIVFSNLSSDADMKKMLDAGAAAFMIKSNFTLDEVVDKIKSLIS